MALEALHDIKHLDGFAVRHFGTEEAPDGPRNAFISLDRADNSLTFQFQNGPIKEVGINGCQITALLHAFEQILTSLNKLKKCQENDHTLRHIVEAIRTQEQRTARRTIEGTEGTNKETPLDTIPRS